MTSHQLGIRKVSKVEFLVVDDHVELRVSSFPALISESGLGLLKSKRKSMPASLDPAKLIKENTVKL